MAFKNLFGKPNEDKKDRIDAANNRSGDGDSNATEVSEEQRDRIKDYVRSINIDLIELFQVGDDSLTFSELLDKYSPSMLKVLDFTKMTRTVCYWTDDNKVGARVPAALESAYAADMDRQRKESSKKDEKIFSMPIIKIKDRDDGDNSGLTTDEMADALRQAGFTVTPPQQTPPPAPPAPPVDSRLQPLIDQGYSEEAAKQMLAAADAYAAQSGSPTPQPAAPPSSPPGPASPQSGSRRGGAGHSR